MSDGDTWESRMAARAKERASKPATPRTTEQINADNEKYRVAHHPWLHGWGRLGRTTVLIGCGVHCVCCGRSYGITCVAFSEDWEPPTLDPEWPFGELDCPLCNEG